MGWFYFTQSTGGEYSGTVEVYKMRPDGQSRIKLCETEKTIQDRVK